MGPLTSDPEIGRMNNPIAKRAAVRLVTTRDRTRNADELGPHFVAREPNRRITMPAKIDEL